MEKSKLKNYITVVGAVNVDICGTPHQKVINSDSNPGKITMSFGGVGRNIAENISRLGGLVDLITVLGDDFYASEIKKSCQELGIGLSNALCVDGYNTSTYLCVNNEQGDMIVAVNDMDICERLTSKYIESKMSEINDGKLLVIDANIPEETIKYLATNCKVPILAEPVSTKKATKFSEILDKIYLLKPNLLELELLSGVKITSQCELDKAVNILLEKGVKNLIVSMGSNGVYYGTNKGKTHYPCLPCKVINTTGCGDALIGAVAYALLKGEKVSVAINYGLAASAICIEHRDAISITLNEENLIKRMKHS